MPDYDEQQAELLSQYQQALSQSRKAAPPAGLDPELAALAQTLHRHAAAPIPDAGFAKSLQAELEAQLFPTPNPQQKEAINMAQQTYPTRRRFATAYRPLATFAVVALIALGAWAVYNSVRNSDVSASAQQIVNRAIGVFSGDSIKSMVITSTTSVTASTDITNAIWYQLPNKWRIEGSNGYAMGILPPSFSNFSKELGRRIEVSDGTNLWLYSTLKEQGSVSNDLSRELYINLLANKPLNNGETALMHVAPAQYRLVSRLQSCKLVPQSDDTVAGRAAYVIAATACADIKSMAEMTDDLVTPTDVSKVVVWIDQITYFPLKVEYYDSEHNLAFVSETATYAQFNQPIDAATFTFTPPLGTTIADNRSNGGSRTEFDAQMQIAANEAGYPIFTPSYVPEGFTLKLPQIRKPSADAAGVKGLSVAINVAPSNDVNQSIYGWQEGVALEEKRVDNGPTYFAGQSEFLYANGRRAWRFTNAKLAGRNGEEPVRFITTVVDGTQIGVVSSVLPEDELVKVLVSMTRLPVTQPIATPTPPFKVTQPQYPVTIDEVRNSFYPFHVFVPTSHAANPIAEPPVVFGPSATMIEVNYHTSDDKFALSVLSGQPGCCLDAQPDSSGEAVTLADGTAAHYLNRPIEQGGPTLWLIRDKTYVEVRGPNMGKDELLQIANSLSDTAQP